MPADRETVRNGQAEVWCGAVVWPVQCGARVSVEPAWCGVSRSVEPVWCGTIPGIRLDPSVTGRRGTETIHVIILRLLYIDCILIGSIYLHRYLLNGMCFLIWLPLGCNSKVISLPAGGKIGAGAIFFKWY